MPYHAPMDRTQRPRALFIFATTLALCHASLYAQTPSDPLALSFPDRIRVSERTNLSTQENGTYAGLLNRQVTGYLTRTEGSHYEGRFFLYEKVRRDLRDVARPVDRSFETRMEIAPDSLFVSADDYPSLQSIPSLPTRSLSQGDSWSSTAWVTIEPRRGDAVLRLPVTVAYRYGGLQTWNNAPAHRIDAEFATRYPLPPSDDEDAPIVRYTGPITQVTGRHELTILLPVFERPLQGGSQVAFIRDEVREHYRFSDRDDLLVQGHVLLFLSGLAVETQQQIASSVEEEMRSAGVEDVAVDRTPTGVRLTVQALRFLPDQAVLLPEERQRLDSVAGALLRLEGQRFLVVGHTADVGTEESQIELSRERARVIAAELAARDVSPDRLDIEGRGGSEPVATNATEPGRAKNRRVEIYIVEE